MTRKLIGRLIIVIALAASARSFAAEQPSNIPAWLGPNVGEGEGKIAQVVLQRARALYFQKLHAAAIRNPCYLAMDATRPHDLRDGKMGAAVLRDLRIEPIFPCIFGGSRRRPRFERYRVFR